MSGCKRGDVITLNKSSGSFHSSNHPFPYPVISLCTWNITAPTGYRIKLSFSSMDIDPSQHCISDSMKIRDGMTRESPLLGRYCGNNSAIPLPVVSSGPNMLVILTSDGINKATGFLADYSMIPPHQSEYFTFPVSSWTNFTDASSVSARKSSMMIGAMKISCYVTCANYLSTPDVSVCLISNGIGNISYIMHESRYFSSYIDESSMLNCSFDYGLCGWQRLGSESSYSWALYSGNSYMRSDNRPLSHRSPTKGIVLF